jgi:hypothetical protein
VSGYSGSDTTNKNCRDVTECRPPRQFIKTEREDKMKYKLELNKDELNLISQKIYAAWFEIFFTEGDEILSVRDADEKHMLSNILQKIKELK